MKWSKHDMAVVVCISDFRIFKNMSSTFSFNQLDSLLISDTQRSVNRLFSTMLVRAELICSLKTFYKIFHVCEGINTIFSVQILIALILVHVLLTCIMYVMTETVVNYLSGKQPLDHYIMYTNVYWFAFYWVMIGLLVVPCENIVTLVRN